MTTYLLEIRAGVGGEDASLWVDELARMYARYLAAHNATLELLDSAPHGKGFRSLLFRCSGKACEMLAETEPGVHRVQRVSKTEKRGRVHTSSATVALLPVAPKRGDAAKSAGIEGYDPLNPADLEITTFIGPGPGGQHRNKTASAVRVRHIPSGMVVTATTDRSQITNRQNALQVLQARLLERSRSARAQQTNDLRRSQIGSGSRAEKCRTYDFPEGVVIDPRFSVRPPVKRVVAGQLQLLIGPAGTARRATVSASPQN